MAGRTGRAGWAIAAVILTCSCGAGTTTTQPATVSGPAASGKPATASGQAASGVATPVAGATECEVTPRTDGMMTAIDWVDFVQFGGVSYLKVYQAGAVPTARLGATLGAVRCTLADRVTDPAYRQRDLDAAFLQPGTVLRSINGFRPTFRIAAGGPQGWVAYEADDVPGARTGADLLDLAGKVTRIDLVEGDRGIGVLRSVADRQKVNALVDAVLAAPVRAFAATGGEQNVILRFRLADGDVVERAWFVKSGIVGRGIVAPAELTAALAPSTPAR